MLPVYVTCNKILQMHITGCHLYVACTASGECKMRKIKANIRDTNKYKVEGMQSFVRFIIKNSNKALQDAGRSHLQGMGGAAADD